MELWTDLLLGSPYGLSSLIVIIGVIAIGGYLGWFFVKKSK
jgi:LPXTG-motif cell wall-anchored protein